MRQAHQDTVFGSDKKPDTSEGFTFGLAFKGLKKLLTPALSSFGEERGQIAASRLFADNGVVYTLAGLRDRSESYGQAHPMTSASCGKGRSA